MYGHSVDGEGTWEDRLAAEGLSVVCPGTAVSSKARGMSAVQLAAYTVAVDEWQAWARLVLERHPFANAHQRRIWELHTGGTPMRDIPALVARRRHRDRRDGHGASRASVERVIASVNAEYPERPANPWSSRTVPSGGEPPEQQQPAVRHLPPDELRALPYQPPERKTTLMQKTYRYDLIMFSRRKSIPIPGREIANDRLLNVEGTPHAGGIDVIVGGKVITVSWDSISHTVRDAETAPAAK